MTVYKFSELADGQRIAFVANADVLSFDSNAISASQVRLTQVGSDLSVTAGGRTFWLDGLPLGALAAANVAFADGSLLVVGDRSVSLWQDALGQRHDFSASANADQILGLGGADLVRTGAGDDWLVGNIPIGPMAHVSSLGATGGNATSRDSSVSADGRYVVFFSDSTNLATPRGDVHFKDLETGAITIESGIGTYGVRPVLSADGRWVVFESGQGVVQGAPAGMILIASTPANPVELTEVVSITFGGQYPDRNVHRPDVSADGRFVVFLSDSTNFAPGGNTWDDVFLKDRDTGALTRVSTSLAGNDGSSHSFAPKISPDGRYVVFHSLANDLVPGDTNNRADVFLWDRTSGELGSVTVGLSSLPDTTRWGFERPDVGVDAAGKAVVVFETDTRLLPADTQNNTDVYVWSMADGAVRLVSSSATGLAGNGQSQEAAISGDGRFVVFRSFAENLVPGDSNGHSDIFVKDLLDGRIALLSRPDAGGQANGDSLNPAISVGGDWIAFESRATNLAATDATVVPSDRDVFRVYNPLLRDTLEGGDGNDTYVIERLADIVVEQPGGGNDTVMTPLAYTLGEHLENLTLVGDSPVAGAGNALPNLIRGNAAANLLSGLAGDDTLEGGAGNDTLDGGAGVDVAVYAGNRANYQVTLSAPGAGTATVTALSGNEGSDQLASIERLWFADRKLAIDFGYTGHAEITAKILGAVFGPAAVANATYAGIGLTLLESGFDYASLMQLALEARLGPGFANETMVAVLLENLGVTPTPPDVAFYAGLIAAGSFTQVSLAIVAADHPLNTDGIGLAGLQAGGLEYVV